MSSLSGNSQTLGNHTTTLQRSQKAHTLEKVSCTANKQVTVLQNFTCMDTSVFSLTLREVIGLSAHDNRTWNTTLENDTLKI